MITNAILKFFSMFYQFLIALVPKFSFIESLISAKNNFIDFLSTFISYTLYLFNIPVLRIAMGLLIGYLTFLVAEYLIKLGLKYITNLF